MVSNVNSSVSVVITCYNYEAFVASAIDSALDQTILYSQIIVVDDGSTDASLDVINRYADRVLVVSQPNTGHLGACLAGLEHVTADYVHFLDADDRSLPNLVGTVGEYVSLEPVKIQFQLEVIDASGEPVGSVYPTYQDGYSTESMIEDNEVMGFYQAPPTSGNVFRVDLLRELSLERLSPRAALDGAANLVMPYCGSIVSLNRVLAQYGVHGESLSNSHGVPTVEQADKELREFRQNWTDARRILDDHRLAVDEENSLYAMERRIVMAALQGQMVYGLIPPYLSRLSKTHLRSTQKLLQGAWISSLVIPATSVRSQLIQLRRSGANRPRILREIAALIRR